MMKDVVNCNQKVESDSTPENSAAVDVASCRRNDRSGTARGLIKNNWGTLRFPPARSRPLWLLMVNIGVKLSSSVRKRERFQIFQSLLYIQTSAKILEYVQSILVLNQLGLLELKGRRPHTQGKPRKIEDFLGMCLLLTLNDADARPFVQQKLYVSCIKV